MSYTPFRVPKGVPSDIRRALRLGHGGSFLSYVKATQLATVLEAALWDVSRDHDKAVRAYERVRRPATRAKYAALIRDSQARWSALETALDDLLRMLEPPEPLAVEWELGVMYDASENFSDCQFNARLFRADGEPMTEAQVVDAIANFARHDRGTLEFYAGGEYVPVEVKAVDWANWKGAWKYDKDRQRARGKQSDLENFRGVLKAVGERDWNLEPWRLGAVKESGL